MSKAGSQRGYHARSNEPWTRLTHKERKPGWFAYNPRTMRPPPLSSDANSMKILSWNVNGLQTAVDSGFSAEQLAGRENFDVLCLQETHLQASCVAFILFIYTASRFPDGLCVASLWTQDFIVIQYIMIQWVFIKMHMSVSWPCFHSIFRSAMSTLLRIWYKYKTSITAIGHAVSQGSIIQELQWFHGYLLAAINAHHLLFYILTINLTVHCIKSASQ